MMTLTQIETQESATEGQVKLITRMIGDTADSDPVQNALTTLTKDEAERLKGNADFTEALRRQEVEMINRYKKPVPNYVPPVGGRIITIKAIVKPGQEWQAAVNSAGPNTPNNYDVRKVAHLFPPTGEDETEEEFVLLNYPDGSGSWEKALEWGRRFNLPLTTPRDVFGIGSSHPKFNYEQGPNLSYVTSTTECTFDGDRRACFVWWDGSEREASLGWLDYCGSAHGWFAFRKR